MRLIHIHYSDNSEPWAEFEEIKGKKFTDFEKVKEQIEELTNAVCGKNGGIINKFIKLNIHSKTCPDLTVIDIPGITRIPLHGSDQPDNIEQITKEICLKYCGDKTTVILCVMQANVDVTTSEALHMAMKLDPTGDRTIGVLTKLDLMDSGTSAKSLLEGAEVPLKNGYVALKNRSQLDLQEKLPVNIAIQKEMLFFKSHPTYSKMNSSYFGIENLVDKLRKCFFEHLKLFLPGIYMSIKDKIHECKKALDELGSDHLMMINSYGSPINYLNQIVNKYSEHYEKIFEGKSPDLEENMSNHTLKLYYSQFLTNLDYKPSEKIHKTFITEMLVRSEGITLSGFPESDVFHEILNTEYENIKLEVSLFYEKVYEIIISNTHKLTEKYFKRFPPLKAKIFEIVNEFIDENFNKAKYISNCIVDMNLNYLFIEDDKIFHQKLRDILGYTELERKQQLEAQNNNRNNNNNNQDQINKNKELERQKYENAYLQRKSSDIQNEYLNVNFL